MLSKCANPVCTAPFLYLSQGKLYKLETSVRAGNLDRPDFADSQNMRAERRLEYFWLCEECAPKVLLTYNRATGIGAAPLAKTNAKAAGAK